MTDWSVIHYYYKFKLLSETASARLKASFEAGDRKTLEVQIMSTAQSGERGLLTNTTLRDKLVRAHFAPPSSVEVTFADGYSATLPAKKLGMPRGRIHWATITVTPDGENLAVTAIKGEQITIDARRMRFLSDEGRANEIRQALQSLRRSREALRELSRNSRPPDGLRSEPAEDAILESWK
jgi:hypothetical protein